MGGGGSPVNGTGVATGSPCPPGRAVEYRHGKARCAQGNYADHSGPQKEIGVTVKNLGHRQGLAAFEEKTGRPTRRKLLPSLYRLFAAP